MSTLSKRKVALLLTAVMVVASTLISVDAKLGEKARQVSYGFYDGVYVDGYQQKGIGEHLKNLCSYADGLVTIANNYAIDTEEVSDASQTMKWAMTYDQDDISYQYWCYSELRKTVEVLTRQMEQAELNERDASGLNQYSSNINGAVSAIESSGYNATVREFMRRYDHFPADFLAELAGVDMPEYFGY